MMFLAIAAAVLFLVPAYNRLRAKGYAPGLFLWPTIMLVALGFGLGTVHPAGQFLCLVISAGLYVLAVALPERQGAPGNRYLRITFPCPECGRQISFGRDYEGRAELCPLCGELITVPIEGVAVESPPSPAPAPPKRGGSRDPVELRRFLNPEQAEMARQRLNAANIDAFVADSIVAHIHPGAEWASGGVRLMVAAGDIDAAREVLALPAEETALSDDFVPPPAPSQPEDRGANRFAQLLLGTLVFLVVFPFVLMKMWIWIVPALFSGAVRRGVLRQSLSFYGAFKMTVAIALTFVATAFFWISGRRKDQTDE